MKNMRESRHLNKILVVFYEPFFSGIGRHIEYLISSLLDRNELELIIALPNSHLNLYKEITKKGIKAYICSMNKFFSLRGGIFLRNLAALHKVNIIHVHGIEIGFWVHLFFVFSKKRIPILHTPHTSLSGIDSPGVSKKKRFLHLGYLIIWRLYSRFTDVIICLTPSQKLKWSSWSIRPKSGFRVIPNAVNEQNIPEPSQNQIMDYKGSNTILIGQVGRLTEQKNPLGLVESALINSKRLPNAKYLLIGDGPLRKEIETHIKKWKLENVVFITGWSDKVLSILKQIDIAVLYSNWEGLSYTLLEYMAGGKPIIASDIDGNRDAIFDGINGILVKPSSSKDLADAIYELANDQEKANEFGDKARRIYEQKYSIKSFSSSYLALYKDLH